MKFKLKIMILAILLVIIAIVAVTTYVFPEAVMFLVVGYGLFILVTLFFGWEHPKRYVKGYAVICFFWEIFWFFNALASPFFGITFLLFLEIGATLPLIPLWYLWYEGYKRERDLLWWAQKRTS